MHIGIDARLIEETGVGRYIQNLVTELGRLDRRNRYTLFLRKKSFSRAVPNARWTKVLADVPWHTVNEQLVMPRILGRERLDVVHVPYHNPPVFYPGNMVVTIHDLTILHFDTGRATTLPPPVYWLKRAGYVGELAVGLRRAKSILTVSETTKRELLDHFRLDGRKITVTYEAADRHLVALSQKTMKKPRVQGEYVLYVGNAYPHKNLEALIAAWEQIAGVQLVLVTPHDYFSKQLGIKIGKQVTMFGPADTPTLANLYRFAKAVVFPSRMEGFGLPGIEAMAVGTAVVCSDIPVFREIYGRACVYFDPRNAHDIAQKIRKVLDDEVMRKELIVEGKKQAARYSWPRLAKQTLDAYERSARL